MGAFEHAEIPFDVLVDGLRPERSTDRAPIFQVLFAFQSFPTTVQGTRDFTVEHAAPPDTHGARFDLALEMAEHEGKLVLMVEYATDLFEDATIARLQAQLGRLLRAVAADPQARVDDLPPLPPAAAGVLHGWNATELEHDRTRGLHQLLEATARARPEAPAATAGETTLTFRALDERANRLAHLLVRLGVKPGDRVAVCLDRTTDMPVAIAAVLKAGAAYVPLDPTHPADRLRYVLEDAGTAAGVTLGRFAPILEGAGTPLVRLDEAEAELAALPATPPAVTVRPEDVAYVMYTSGSTGRPKGVEVMHGNVVAFVESMRRTPGFGAGDVLLAVTTLSFDIAGLELWLPMATGGRIVIASRGDVLDGERLVALLQEHGVTMLQATPSTWRLLLGAGWAGKQDLKALCGGEALPRDLAAALVPRVGELWNMYGPTETTIWSTLDRVTDAEAPITVGRPIHNTRVYVLERSGQLAPIGVAGELCIGGEGVARGYYRRPELTAEKFTTIALPGGRSERVYRTGDVARLRSDGRLDFLGRRDHQVKVRGHRIELGEIEAVLAGHPGVRTCVVTVREDAPGDQRIVGYVVPVRGAAFDAEAARTTLRARLPEYMVPNAFVTLEAMPLTPSGKIDRKVLPAPAAQAPVGGDAGDALMTPVQRKVAGAWREVLRVDRVGLNDNFFDIGGHSLLLVKLHATLKRDLGCELSLVELFQWTTVAAQAARVAAAAPPDSALRRAQARAARQTDG
jgi:amino acid adenylation domain-containing protein